jgi:hypothetical protein
MAEAVVKEATSAAKRAARDAQKPAATEPETTDEVEATDPVEAPEAQAESAEETAEASETAEPKGDA